MTKQRPVTEVAGFDRKLQRKQFVDNIPLVREAAQTFAYNNDNTTMMCDNWGLFTAVSAA